MKKQNIELISVNDLDMMDFEECRDLYAKYINATKASLLQKFISSRQMINKAEGAMIFTRTYLTVLVAMEFLIMATIIQKYSL